MVPQYRTFCCIICNWNSGRIVELNIAHLRDRRKNRLVVESNPLRRRRRKKYNKKVSEANESRTLLRYSITYYYDLISLSISDANWRMALCVANSTRLPYLDVRGMCTSMDSTPFASVTACTIGSDIIIVRIEFYPVRVLSCLYLS